MNTETFRRTGCSFNLATIRRGALSALAVGLVAVLGGVGLAQDGAPPVKVTIKDEQAVVVERVFPVDPVRRINYQPNGLVARVMSETNQTLQLSGYANVSIDGRVYQQGQGGVMKVFNQPLGKGKGGKVQEGFTSTYVYGDITVTATISVVPTKAEGTSTKRRRDSMLTHYVIENHGKEPHKVGLRMTMDTYVITNDGCQFAAPTMPGRVLNGVELKDKTMPPYVQLLQNPDLKNPGFVAHLTLDLGPRLDKADRVVLTGLGAVFQPWEVQAMVSGDTALAVFWEPKEIKAGGKREFAYGYGQGLVPNQEGEGRVNLEVGGSFVPGKVFTVAAHVSDPAPGQFLTLELPEGMERLEGQPNQPVPQAQGEEPYTVVYWRARVLRPGEFPVRVRSSTGVTQGKVITVTPAK